MIEAVMAASNTAAAPRSLIVLIFTFFSVEIKSIIFSMAVLNSSLTQTNPTAKVSAIASERDTYKPAARNITTAVPNKWIHALCWLLKKSFMPAKA